MKKNHPKVNNAIYPLYSHESSSSYPHTTYLPLPKTLLHSPNFLCSPPPHSTPLTLPPSFSSGRHKRYRLTLPASLAASSSQNLVLLLAGGSIQSGTNRMKKPRTPFPAASIAAYSILRVVSEVQYCVVAGGGRGAGSCGSGAGSGSEGGRAARTGAGNWKNL
jgi:hypothetical protein